MVLLLAHHQVLFYHSLAKLDSRMKSKSLVSQDYSYGIAFMDKNVMAEILVLLNPQSLTSIRSLSVHLNLRSLLGLTTLVAAFLNSSKHGPMHA